MTTIAVALSGGIDSSVVAALLRNAGYDIVGVTMKVLPDKDAPASLTDTVSEIGRALDIPVHVFELRSVFDQFVVQDFCHEYCQGRTPNPCVRCNCYVKFGTLRNESVNLGADRFATGHYACIVPTNDGFQLRSGVDRAKDQSYFLYRLTQTQLANTLMPLGIYTKKQVWELAGELKLPVTAIKESQEICFIPDDNYRKFVTDQCSYANKPGPILDREGETIGEHRGIINYTIGQRRGLGLSAGSPMYVLEILPEMNAIRIGAKEELYRTETIVKDVHWIYGAYPKQAMMVEAKIRYTHQPVRARLLPTDNRWMQVSFERPQMALTPGQSVVFYESDMVLGGGTIA